MPGQHPPHLVVAGAAQLLAQNLVRLSLLADHILRQRFYLFHGGTSGSSASNSAINSASYWPVYSSARNLGAASS